MSNYTIVRKNKVRGVTHIPFNSKTDPKSGTVEFCNIKKLSALHDINRVVITDEVIDINFPIFDHYFIQKVKSKNGWTLKKLILNIYKVGMNAATYLYKYQPSAIKEFAKDPVDYMNSFMMVSANKKSDITMKGGCVFVNLRNNSVAQQQESKSNETSPMVEVVPEAVAAK